MRVALLGTFDIANYGDLLFPEIVRARLEGIAEVTCYSPLQAPAVWKDTAPTLDVDLLPDHDVDAVVLGGGNLVHAKPWNHDWYDTGGTRGYTAYPRLWFGGSVAAARRAVPLCWNAVGVGARLGPAEAALVREAAEVADYLSVRDRGSARELAAAGVASGIEIVPDPGLDVAGLWSEPDIDAAHRDLWSAAGRPAPERTVAVHLSSRYVDEPARSLAARLDSIARRLEATVVLVPLGPCHGDDVLAERVGGVMETAPLVVPAAEGIRTLAAAIARADGYLGSSMHGAITAVAFGVPARVVGSGPATAKWSGFCEQFGRLDQALPAWADAEALASPALLRAGGEAGFRDAAAPLLDRHWDRIADVLVRAGIGARPPARSDLGPDRLERLLPSVLDALGSTIGDLRRRLSASQAEVEDRAEPPAVTVREPTPPERPAAATTRRLSVAVVSWDLGHNALGRAHLLADMLAGRHDVEIVGSHFPEFGSEVWRPLRDSAIPLRRYPGGRFPEYFGTMERMAAELTAEVVYAVKPRLPGLGVGMLARCDRGRGLAVDCDDLELSFVGSGGGIPLGELPGLRSHPDLLRPQGRIWTSFSEWAVRLADGVTVSNVPLAARYGGVVIPHARDETVFDPDRYDREEAGARLGVKAGERVVLFAGTPRRHKGIQQVAAALERIGDPRNRLCVLATRELDEMKSLLAGYERWIHPLAPQPFSQLPQLLAAADAVCVLQDPDSEMARWQMPAKVTDALAMGIPCLATPTAPLLPLIDDGALLPVGGDDLAEVLEAVLADPSVRAGQARRGREVFLRRFSYAAVRPRLEEVLAKAAARGGTTAPSDLAAAVSFQRSLFAPPAVDAAVAPPAGARGAVADPAPPRAEVVPRPRPRPRRSPDDRLDIVMFWRQNDSGIYGRRPDMLVKYLAASPRVRRIVHFDDAVSVPALVTRWRDGRGDAYSQSSLVVKQTVRRLRGTRPHPKVSAHTFVHRGGADEPGGRLRRVVPPRADYEAWVADVLARNGVGSHPLVFWAYPTHGEFPAFVRRFAPDLVVADVVDDTRKWSGEGQRKRLSDNYAEVLGLSDVVIANCEAVKRSMEEFAAGIHVVPNACEVPSGPPRRLRRPRDIRKLRGPLIGYVGNLSSRIDIDLLEHVAGARPEWHLVLIGSAHLNRDVLQLGALENVHLLGVRPYDELQAYLQAFDVGIVPHVDDDMTRIMNPLKVFVYSAANLPVVSTAVSNIDEMRSLVRVAGDPEEFVERVEEALREGRGPSVESEHRTLLEEHSWSRRVEQVLQLVDAGLATAGAA